MLQIGGVGIILDLKWSNPAGHLAKLVILPTEVRDDDREKAAAIHA